MNTKHNTAPRKNAFPLRSASKTCLDCIKRHEDEAGFLAGRCSQLRAYRPVPTDPWTIGWGHAGGDVREGMTITPEEADQMLLADVEIIEAQLAPLVAGFVLTQGQYDALVSLAYNVGARRLPILAPKLWRYLREGKREMAAAELLDINRSAGHVLAGLTTRRQDEAKLFLS